MDKQKWVIEICPMGPEETGFKATQYDELGQVYACCCFVRGAYHELTPTDVAIGLERLADWLRLHDDGKA